MSAQTCTHQSTALVFIDSALPDLATLQAGLPHGLEVHLLDPRRDGLQQIAAALENRQGITALHLITHGAPGKLFLGNTAIGCSDLSGYRTEINTLTTALVEDGEWLIYGCEVAAGREGRQFMDALTEMTGLKVAAATHKVGAAALGGDWELNVGMPVVQTLRVAGWGHVLGDATPPVFVSMTASGSVITLLFDEPLAPSNVPTPDMFAVTVNGESVVLADPNPTAISGSSVILNLASPLATGAAVSVVYAEPTEPSAMSIMLKDLANNWVAYFADPVTANATVSTAFTFNADTTNGGNSDYTETQAGVTLTIAGAYWGSSDERGSYITGDLGLSGGGDGQTTYVFSQAIDISSIDWISGNAGDRVQFVDLTPDSTKTETFTLTGAGRQTLTLTGWQGVTQFKIVTESTETPGGTPGLYDKIDNIVFAVSEVVSLDQPVIDLNGSEEGVNLTASLPVGSADGSTAVAFGPDATYTEQDGDGALALLIQFDPAQTVTGDRLLLGSTEVDLSSTNLLIELDGRSYLGLHQPGSDGAPSNLIFFEFTPGGLERMSGAQIQTLLKNLKFDSTEISPASGTRVFNVFALQGSDSENNDILSPVATFTVNVGEAAATPVVLDLDQVGTGNADTNNSTGVYDWRKPAFLADNATALGDTAPDYYTSFVITVDTTGWDTNSRPYLGVHVDGRRQNEIDLKNTNADEPTQISAAQYGGSFDNGEATLKATVAGNFGELVTVTVKAQNGSIPKANLNKFIQSLSFYETDVRFSETRVFSLKATIDDGDDTETATSTFSVGFADPAPVITYSATSFAEATANDGSITASITLTLENDTYTGTNGDALAGAVVTNVPAGLTAVVTKTSNTVATVTFTGKATAHANAQDVDDLTITLGDTAFTGASAAAVTNATKSDLAINFADSVAPVIGGITTDDNSSFAAGTYTYLDAASDYAFVSDADSDHFNDGYLSVEYSSGPEDGTFRFDPDLFLDGAPTASVAVLASNNGGTTLKTDGSFAAGDSIVVIYAGDPVTQQIIGVVDATADGQAGIPLKINFTTDDATTGESSNDGTVGFVLQFLQYTAPTGGERTFAITANDGTNTSTPAAVTLTAKAITYSATSFAEAAANDGSITASITLTLANDTYTGTNGDALTGAVVSNVPTGLTAVVTKTSNTVATVTFTGKATAHANANDIANLTITLSDAAFTGGSAEAIANATKSNLVIDFANPAPAPDPTPEPPAPAPEQPPAPAPTPAPAPAPAPSTETVDGTTVQTQTSTQTGSSGQTTTTTQTIAPVSDTRPEDPNSANGALADIPLVKNSAGEPLLQVSLPVGVGLTSESTTGSGLTLREKLIQASEPRIEMPADFIEVLGQGIDQYVPGVANQDQVTVRTITLTMAGSGNNPPEQPIVIRGTTGTGENDSTNPQRAEALVIDARQLPPGTVLDLSLVEFAIVIGPTTAIGGSGRNFVIGDGSAQFLVLGADDDVLRGGDGNDTIGSKGGNDQLFGDGGNDWVVGGIGNDTLEGGDGNDLLQGGPSDAGQWRFALTLEGRLQVDFTPSSTELADSTGLHLTNSWSNNHGSGLVTDERLAWVYDNYQLAQDTALLVHALGGRLPTLAEMGHLAGGNYSSQQLGEMAHAYWQGHTLLTNQPLETQLTGVINRVWGVGSASTALTTLGVNHLNAGGSWSAIWLALARDSHHTSQLIDAQGHLQLIDQQLSETGWSADAGSNTLLGGAGNDILVGGSGSDVLDGGEGIDMAVYLGTPSDYEVTLTPNAAAGVHDVLIRHQASGAVDVLRNVELLRIGATSYQVPAGQHQPADNVYVELKDYVLAVGQASLSGLGFNPDWL